MWPAGIRDNPIVIRIGNNVDFTEIFARTLVGHLAYQLCSGTVRRVFFSHISASLFVLEWFPWNEPGFEA